MSPRTPRPPKTRPPDPNALDATWRLFLAVPLPEDVQALLANQVAELSTLDWPVRWVQPEMAHLTLRFLGESDREHAELLRMALPAVVQAEPAFDLRTAALGVFPNFRHPRVLWIGLHGPAHRLERLVAEVDSAVAELGFGARDEAYHPHITLGRVRNQSSETVKLRDLPAAVKARFVNAETGAAIVPPSVALPVREVQLVRSHLGKGGASYEVVASFPLG
jgi:RNA 2',3'-cyclic 3'-phosphodiesterase